MSRYFFDIHDGNGLHRDEFGDEFATLHEAREQCRLLLPDIARGEMLDGESRKVSCDVREETGRIVYRGELMFLETRDPV